MSLSPNLTGRWSGHYVQRDHEYPISADLVQNGSNLNGSMKDGQPDRESTLFKSAFEAGLPPGSDEQIEAKLREVVPDAPPGRIHCVSHLPAESTLKGRCKGNTIDLVKTYQGTCFGGYKVGDKLVGIQKDGHSVHYHGNLSADAQVIEGRWWIDADPSLRTSRCEGQFILRREQR